MTLRGALQKKFGQGVLHSLFLYPRIWHVFQIYAREYLKGASPEEKLRFERTFGK